MTIQIILNVRKLYNSCSQIFSFFLVFLTDFFSFVYYDFIIWTKTQHYNTHIQIQGLRQVKVVGGPLNGSGTRSAFPVIEITGYDGKGGSDESESKVCTTRPSSLDDLWQVSGSVRSPTTAKVDFSRRGGPDEPILVTYENGAILFPDGNNWKKIPEQKDRRPKDLSTLSDGPKFRERDDDDYDY